MPQHWVVIETGANQAYIFGTNKQRVNVGASALVAQVGDWAEAAATNPGATCVVAASGKALILTEDVETGRRIIEDVTRRALRQAPGLEVWGVVDEVPVSDDADLGPALARAHRLHASWRGHMVAPCLRNPVHPWMVPCRISGAAANDTRQDVPVSMSVARAWARTRPGAESDQSWGAMARYRMSDVDKANTVFPVDLDMELANSGWIAVVHADGNGIGQIFTQLADHHSGTDFLRELRAFSQALGIVTVESFKAAITAVASSRSDTGRGWLLPLVIGGDDVTFVCEGESAVALTVAYLTEFMARAAADATVSKIARKVLGRPGLSAAAGIAIVKPKHPFSDGYRLAEQLSESAKQVKQWDPDCSAVDFHVLHDSMSVGLAEIRRRAATGVGTPALFGGPYVVPPKEHVVASVAASDRLYAQLESAICGVSGSGPLIGGSLTHELRTALLASVATTRAAAARAKQISPQTARYLDEHLIVKPVAGRPFTRLIDAMDLADVRHGTAHRRSTNKPATAGGGIE